MENIAAVLEDGGIVVSEDQLRHIEKVVNSNQKLLFDIEMELNDCATISGKCAGAFRTTSILLAAAIPLTQIQGADKWTSFHIMAALAAVLGGLAAIVSGILGLYKFEAKAQGARVLSAVAEAKRQFVYMEAIRINSVKCPKERFGQAMGLLSGQNTCLEQVRAKSNDFDLSVHLDDRSLAVHLDGRFEPTPEDPANQGAISLTSGGSLHPIQRITDSPSSATSRGTG